MLATRYSIDLLPSIFEEDVAAELRALKLMARERLVSIGHYPFRCHQEHH
jgi:hypothetical protein